MNTNLFGSFNSPIGGKNNIPSDTYNHWNWQYPEQPNFSPVNGHNQYVQPKVSECFDFSPKHFNQTEHITGYSNGYTSGYDKGFNSGYLKAKEEQYKLNSRYFNDYDYHPNNYFSNSSNYNIQPTNYNQSIDYNNGYNCGIQNYINAINLINAFNPNKTQNLLYENHNHYNQHKYNKQNKPYNQNNQNNKNKQNKQNKQNKHWQSKNKKSSSEKQKDIKSDYSHEPLEKVEPFLIIEKITKNSFNKLTKGTTTDNISSLFTNSLNCEDDNLQKCKVNYLEDSDDENDNLVSINDIKCGEKYINDKKSEFNDIKIISLKEIIEKDNINSIDDLITIGNYYEKNYFINKQTNTDNTIKDTCENDTTDTDNDEDLKIMESIIKRFNIPDTYTVRIDTIFDTNTNTNTKTKTTKNVLLSSENNISHNEKIFELYKIQDTYFTINLEKVFNMKGHLIKLKKMIGLENIKNEIIDMILYYLMEFEKKNNNMLHMTLEGSPGCGKTKLAKIISKLLGAMGILDNDKVVYARRTDMIGQYLGQTGHKTQNVIDSALGGVLFIDEAYSLGNSKKDIYSKECLDILNQNLSDNKKKLVCIIAGYSEELENYFFSSNPGLTRRFPFRFKINNYTHTELLDIFINKINKLNWKLDINTDLEEFFEKNILHFKYFGGDIDTFIQDIKYSHSRRVVCSHPSEFRIITKADIKSAFDKFKNRRKNNDSEIWKGMYV